MNTASALKVHVLRLLPGSDLKAELERLVLREAWTAACVLSAVGSFSVAVLRFAGAPAGTRLAGPFELLSLSGTLGPSGLHLHLSIADAGGRTWGGHLMPGCLVHTTLELVLGELVGLRFERLLDPGTGYPELVIHPTASRT